MRLRFDIVICNAQEMTILHAQNKGNLVFLRQFHETLISKYMKYTKINKQLRSINNKLFFIVS